MRIFFRPLNYKQILIMLSLCLLFACAKQENPTKIDWQLNESANASYLTLLIDQSMRSNDLEGMKEAAKILANKAEKNPKTLEKQELLDTAAWLLLAREIELSAELLLKAQIHFSNDLNLHLLLSESYLELGQVEKALDILLAFSARNPQQKSIRQELAILYAKAGRNAEALALFEKLPTNPPKLPHIEFFHAQALKIDGQFEKAAQMLENLLAKNPLFFEAWIELAAVFSLQQQLTKAEKAYENMLALNPSIQDPWLYAIQFYIDTNQAHKALNTAKKAPQSYAFLYTVASLLLEQGAFEEAVELTKDLLKEQPNDPALAFLQANIAYNHQRNADKALRYLQSVPPDSEHYAQALYFNIHILVVEGRLKEALEYIEKTRATAPKNAELQNLEIQLLIEEDQHEKALARLEQNFEDDPANDQWLYMKGSIYHGLDRLDEAFDAMEEVLDVNPNNHNALNYVGYSLIEEDKDLKRGLTLLQKAVQLAPNNPYILDSLAWAEYKNGLIEKALKTIKKALAQPDVNEATIWEHYGDIAKAAGQKKEALTAWEKALSLEPENAKELQEKLQKNK